MTEETITSEYKKSLMEMYDLGVKHGYEHAQKDLEIEKLEKEIAALKEKA